MVLPLETERNEILKPEIVVKVRKLRVYIAGPITLGDRTLNLRAAILAADEVLRAGHLPFIPHLNDLWHLVCPHPAEDWYEWDNHWLSVCNVLVRLPGESVGADNEVALAKSLGIMVCRLEEFLQYFDQRNISNAPHPE
jgi:hypothetical protein